MDQQFKCNRWKPFQKMKKKKVKKVRFHPITTIHIIPSEEYEEERAMESDKRWEAMLECLKISE